MIIKNTHSSPKEKLYYLLHIPANLELEKLLEKHGKSNLLHSYAYVCHAILQGYSRSIKLSTADDFQASVKFVPLDSRILRRTLTRKKATGILEDLIAWRVIERSNKYQVATASTQGRCKGYRFRKKYRFVSIRWIPLSNRPLWKRMARQQERDRQQQQAQARRNKVLQYLERQLSYLKLDFGPAFRHVLQLEALSMPGRKLLTANRSLLRKHGVTDEAHVVALAFIPYTFKPLSLTLPSPLPSTPTPPSYVVSFSSFMRLQRLYRFHQAGTGEEDWEFTKDPKTGRLFTNLTNLARTFRRHLYLESGERLVVVDVGECQPFMFSVLLMERAREIWGDNMPDDVERYCHLTAGRGFYRYIMDRCQVPESQRDAFKKTIFGSIFFCTRHTAEAPDNLAGSVFIEGFPNVYRILCEIKENAPKNGLPVRLMKLESEIILGDVCTRIAAYGEEDFFVATIHDGIVTTKGRAEQVKRLVEDAFWRRLGHVPTVKVEAFSYDNGEKVSA